MLKCVCKLIKGDYQWVIMDGLQKFKNEYKTIITFKQIEERLRKKFIISMYDKKAFELECRFIKLQKQKYEILKKIETFKILQKILKNTIFEKDLEWITSDMTPTSNPKNRTIYRNINRIWKLYQSIINEL